MALATAEEFEVRQRQQVPELAGACMLCSQAGSSTTVALQLDFSDAMTHHQKALDASSVINHGPHFGQRSRESARLQKGRAMMVQQDLEKG